ncbi:MAG: formylglycine-generating enzyme family protein [Saprospiraceae bacterium]|nr:formylglycine-generating enzyme family protein [Saprospiraceae bacterium]
MLKVLLNNEYGINPNSKKVKKVETNNWSLFNLKYQDAKKSASITAQTRSFGENDFGIYNMIGNVSEMVEEKGISKGGSFQHSLLDAKIANNLTYDAPQRWLGFRNICEYHLWK